MTFDKPDALLRRMRNCYLIHHKQTTLVKRNTLIALFKTNHILIFSFNHSSKLDSSGSCGILNDFSIHSGSISFVRKFT